LVNTTSTVLANGSVSILEGGRFMGQAEFMPMLPGDDQIVPYDQDTSVSVARSYPVEAQSNAVVQVEAIREENKRKRLAGVCVVHKKVKSTRYTLRNNSTDRTHPKFYLDHSADSAHGGFVITTQQDCVKAVTGFSRFQCELSPAEERVIDVEEEATYRRTITDKRALSAFLKATSTHELAEAGILQGELREELNALVEREERREIYARIINKSAIPEELAEWRERRLVPVEVLALVAEGAEVAAKAKEISRQIGNHRVHVEKVETSQERLRHNIKSMEKVQNTELVDRYIKDLNNQEDDLIATNIIIEQLTDEQVELEAKVSKLVAQTASETKKLSEAIDA
jgi:hypothetical protein